MKLFDLFFDKQKINFLLDELLTLRLSDINHSNKIHYFVDYIKPYYPMYHLKDVFPELATPVPQVLQLTKFSFTIYTSMLLNAYFSF